MMAINNKEILTKETAVAVKAELAKYADTFDVEETQKLVKEIVSNTVNEILNKWLNKNIDRVLKEVLREELEKIVKRQLTKNKKK